MPNNEITNMCFNLRIQGRYEHMVNDFASANGDDVCLDMLKKIRKTRDDAVGNGLQPKSAISQFKELSENYVFRKSLEKERLSKDEEAEVYKQEYYAAKKKGYVPNKETLLAQIEALYDEGKISIQEYEWGLKGLELVHGLVQTAKELDECHSERSGDDG